MYNYLYETKNLLRIKQTNPAGTAQIIVLIGVNVQCGL